MSYFNPVIDQCESGHYFAKLENHPLQSDRKTPRCPHCMAIGLTKAREELKIAVNDRDSYEAHLGILRSKIPKTLRQYRHNDDNSPSLFSPEKGFTFGYCTEDVDRLLARNIEEGNECTQTVEAAIVAPCVFHDHNYEECIQHSGQVPCMTQSESDLASELDSVKQQLAIAQADDRQAMTYLEQTRQATGHKGDLPSMIESISHMKKTALLGQKFAKAKGRFHSQQAMCDLMDHLGMQCVRPDKSPSKTSS